MLGILFNLYLQPAMLHNVGCFQISSILSLEKVLFQESLYFHQKMVV